MTTDNLSQKISELSRRLKELQTECVSDPANAPELLSDALMSLQVSLGDLSDAEKALKESEEKFQLFIDFTYDWEAWMGPDGKYIHVSPSCKRITGYSAEEFIKNPDLSLDIVHPEDREAFEQHRNQHLTEKTSIAHIDYRIITAKGETRWISHICQPVFGRDGKWLGRRASNRDLTERKSAEEALKISEQRFQLALQNMPVTVATLDRDLRYIWVHNPKGGFTLEDVIGKRVGLSVDSGAAEHIAKFLQDVLNTGKPIKWETPSKTKTGEEIFSETHAEPLRNDDGEITGAALVSIDITERKKAEEALRKSEANMARAQKIAHLGNWEWDLKTNALSSSDEHSRMYGLEPGNYQMDTLINLVHKDDRQYIRDSWLAALYEGKPYNVECRVVRLDGATAILHGEGEAIYDENGQPKGMFGIVQDITECKQAEEALRESEEKYRTLFNSMAEGFALHEIILDEESKPHDYRFLDVNPSFEKLTGLKREEVIGKTELQLFPDDDPQRIEVYGNVALTGQPIHFETYSKRLNKYYEVYAHSPASGQFAALFINITERKKAEEALRKSEHRERERAEELAAMLDAVPTPVIIADDPECTHIIGNRAANELLKLPSGGEISLTAPLERRPHHYKAVKEDRELRLDELPIRRAAKGENVQGFEYTLVFDDGTTRELVAYGTPLRDDQGNPRGAVHTLVDITERNKAEEALQKAHDELELRVAERTAELVKANEELLNAKEAAEEAVRAKAAFLANMSHELRTPLNAVIGFSSLLLEDSLSQEQKEYIERIRIGGESLLALISDILEFSKAEKEKVKLELQPISLKHCIEEALGMVAVQANDKGLNLSYTMSYGLPDTITGDPGRLRQVLANLLSNAVKFTDEGDISVSVSSKVIEGDKRQITFVVKDTGIGMPQDKMDRLFQPFTQLEYTLSRKRDGAGLGLAICKELVELMGGEIWAESDEGRGSTFRFTIQAEAIPGKQSDLGEKGKAAVYENLSAKKPLSILVAEDNPSNQKVLVEMLNRLGYRADAVADGCEVLQALQIRPYDLVFMDIQMPEMDGLTATKEIRKLWPDNGPKIVAITAFAMDGDQEKCLEAGMDGYIAKPVKVDDLATLLKNISPSKDEI